MFDAAGSRDQLHTMLAEASLDDAGPVNELEKLFPMRKPAPRTSARTSRQHRKGNGGQSRLQEMQARGVKNPLEEIAPMLHKDPLMQPWHMRLEAERQKEATRLAEADAGRNP